MDKFNFKKKNLYIVLGLTVMVLFFSLKNEFTSIMQYILKVNLLWLGIGIALIIVFWVLEAVTMYIVIKVYEPYFSFLEVLKLVVATQFFNGITPFAAGGQPFQIYVLNQKNKIALSRVTSISIQNFIVYQTVLIIFGVFALVSTTFFSVLGEVHNTGAVIAGFGLNLLLISILILISVMPKVAINIGNGIISVIVKTPLLKDEEAAREDLKKIVHEFYVDTRVLWCEKAVLIRVASINAFKLLSRYTIAYFVLRAVGVAEVTVLQAIVASAYVALLTSVVPIPGGSVGAEIGFLMFFGSLVVGPQVTAVMLIWRFITYYVGLITGFIVFTWGYCK